MFSPSLPPSLLPLSLPSPSLRELDRERGKLERQEKKIIADIKKMAKTGQMVSSNRCQGVCHPPPSPQAAVRIMAKDLVRTRAHVRKFYLMRANIQAISLKLQVCRLAHCNMVICLGLLPPPSLPLPPFSLPPSLSPPFLPFPSLPPSLLPPSLPSDYAISGSNG